MRAHVLRTPTSSDSATPKQAAHQVLRSAQRHGRDHDRGLSSCCCCQQQTATESGPQSARCARRWRAGGRCASEVTMEAHNAPLWPVQRSVRVRGGASGNRSLMLSGKSAIGLVKARIPTKNDRRHDQVGYRKGLTTMIFSIPERNISLWNLWADCSSSGGNFSSATRVPSALMSLKCEVYERVSFLVPPLPLPSRIV
jgi:hypothetical protein